MEFSGGKGKKSVSGNLIIKTWERCKSIGRVRKSSTMENATLKKKSKSWPRAMDACGTPEDRDRKHPRKRRVATEKGCFSVYVGPEKQRFMIKAEHANHPLFMVLLEEAESEYGFNSQGPLVLPCSVDLFCKVLFLIEEGGTEDVPPLLGCGFHGAYRLLSPPRMISMNQL
ncbi:hypothetical protein SLEP1_g9467 [Rubroshorea leprosula]|uniref:Uncharacterized protein n=1 Tax=Rubroshorea leprosula TaxID=152421 RepID=A0AAV5I504_9ROSI|nr:hypothetical protein SLEP1_g9467 [Rubroshorea leprosula]